MSNPEIPRKPRGFATFSPERMREVASAGGKSAHALGRAHRFTSELAQEAGRKGGAANAQRLRRIREAQPAGGTAEAA